MKNKKYQIRLDEYERSVLLNSLMEMHNELMRDGKDAEPVNELLLKIIDAPQKSSLFRKQEYTLVLFPLSMAQKPKVLQKQVGETPTCFR